MTRRLTKAEVAGRPAVFHGYDGKAYQGQVVALRRRYYLTVVYRVAGFGDVTAIVDVRTQRHRVEIGA